MGVRVNVDVEKKLRLEKRAVQMFCVRATAKRPTLQPNTQTYININAYFAPAFVHTLIFVHLMRIFAYPTDYTNILRSPFVRTFGRYEHYKEGKIYTKYIYIWKKQICFRGAKQ